MCDFVVLSEMKSVSEISLFVNPFEINSKTSTSLVDKMALELCLIAIVSFGLIFGFNPIQIPNERNTIAQIAKKN